MTIKITSAVIRKALQEKMIDPELGMNVVDLGLVYKIKVSKVSGVPKVPEAKDKKHYASRPASPARLAAKRAGRFALHAWKVHILMTLTTPGCPLAAMFGPMVRQALSGIPGIDPYKDVEIELTFDPPWHRGMMSERAKAEIGFG